jgi:hypothetical protein
MADLPFGSLAFVGVYDASRAAKIILGPQGKRKQGLAMNQIYISNLLPKE